MSCLYDTVEPSVVDEEMILRSVEEQGPKEEAGKIAKEEGIYFSDVFSLRLDFKNILKINGLWEFVNLTKLQLDNNIIEKMEGIEKLVNLLWLDLSFNNIETIEGLETLTKLEDLTLYNNRISSIENMDTLVCLQVISLGNNSLKDIENITYLRRFPNLKTLNLSNNPFCEFDNYKLYVAAFLPHLDFLDYRILDEKTKIAGQEHYQINVEEILDDEKKANIKQEEDEKRLVELERHKKAYVEHMDVSELFQDMYSDDIEGQKLKEIPEVQEILILDAFVNICEKIFHYGLDELVKREEELNLFWSCVEEAKEENKEMGVEDLDKFAAYKIQTFAELIRMADPKMIEQKVNEYNTLVGEQWHKLMGYEMQLVDQLEDVIQNMERNMQDLVTFFIENIQGYLAQARDIENVHNERMMEIAQITLDKVVKNEIDDDISDDLRMLFVDKDTVMNAVTTSHDSHLLKIDNKEDDIITRINCWMKNVMQAIHEEEEVVRNRSRVMEINQVIDNLRDEADNLELITAIDQ